MNQPKLAVNNEDDQQEIKTDIHHSLGSKKN